MGTVNDKINYLEETKTLIKNALIRKGIDVSDEDTFRSYVQKIIDYTGIDTSDATATANDILQGQTAYVNGQKVVGNIETYRTDTLIDGDDVSYNANNDTIRIEYTFREDKCYKTDACLEMRKDAESLRNKIGLTADKIRQGETVLGVDGTFSSDATAKASDILSGKSAYVNGQKVEGTIEKSLSPQGILRTSYGFPAESKIHIESYLEENSYIEQGTNIHTQIPYQNIVQTIELTPDKIRQGETVLGLDGTFSSDATANANDIVEGTSAYVNGEKIIGNMAKINSMGSMANEIIIEEEFNDIIFNGEVGNADKMCLESNSTMSLIASGTELATAINLTADKIKSGETVLGVDGTYEGGSSDDYYKRYIEKDWLNNIIILPDDLTKIQDYAFYDYCSYSNKDDGAITYKKFCIENFPDSIELIGNYAFDTYWDKHIDFSKITKLPNNLVKIGSNAFYKNTTLNINKFPDSLKEIYSKAFAQNTALTDIVMLGVQTLSGNISSYGTFYNCSNLKTVRIGAQLTSMGRYVFKGCTSLESIYIDLTRATVESLTGYEYAFMDDTSKTGIIICNDDENWIPYTE